MSKIKKWQVRGFFILWFVICYSPMINSGPLNFLLLNTFLAYIPIEISFQLNHKIIKNSWLFWVFIIMWLLFYPNAAYILTDLFHLSLLNPYNTANGLLRQSVYMWINFLFLLVGALTSAWIGFKTMFNIVDLLMDKINGHTKFLKLVLILIITVLNSIGIYIGRFLRIHSIYLFLSPRLFIRPILNMWTKPMLIFTAIMTIIQLVCYWLIWLTQNQRSDVNN